MKKILVVDNHPVMLKFMTDLLNKKGHQVLTAEDGISALMVLKNYIPDIIFIDLVMPNISGEKLCRIIRNMPSMKDVHLVIVSAIAAEEAIDPSEIGANACIAKGPFNKMSEAILYVLDRLDRDAPQDLAEHVIGHEDVQTRPVIKELLSSRRHFELILSNIAEAVLELNQEGKIIYANPVASILTGISEEALLGLNCNELFPEIRSEMIHKSLKDADDESQVIGEDSLVTLKGKHFLLSIRPFKDKENNFVVIINDISKQKRLETQFQQVQKLEAIATLAGGIAHEFNNALCGLSLNLQLLEMDLSEDECVAKFLKPMKTSTQRMANLTSQLLAYARGGKYNAKPLAFSDFLKGALPLITSKLNPTINLETQFSANGSYVEADQTQIQMVLSAVLNNAAEAIQENGLIKIATATEEIYRKNFKNFPDLNSGRYFCVTIADDGSGMDEKTRAKLFEPFFSTKLQGRGLGMAAVYGIIKNHGGWISVDSEIGRGTVVRIYLPVIDDRAKGQEEEPKPEMIQGEGTILVIEDEEIVMNMMKVLLKELGYDVLEATTGMKAVQIAQTFDRDIHLAILDVMLPDMEGKTIYQKIIEVRPNLQVIVCSGYSIDGPAQDILNLGAQDFIQKPFSISNLSEKLSKVLP